MMLNSASFFSDVQRSSGIKVTNYLAEPIQRTDLYDSVAVAIEEAKKVKRGWTDDFSLEKSVNHA